MLQSLIKNSIDFKNEIINNANNKFKNIIEPYNFLIVSKEFDLQHNEVRELIEVIH